MPIIESDIEIVETISSGTESVVYLAQLISLPIGQFVVKKIRVDGYHDGKFEIDCYNKIQHPNVLSIYNWFIEDNWYYLLMPYISMDLHTFLYNDPVLNEIDIIKIFTQVAKSVKICHDVGIIHRDIKLENYLIDNARCVKLIDFGLACNMDDIVERVKPRGTIECMAPEVLMGKLYDEKCDCYSLGVLLYNLVFKRSPYKYKKKAGINTLLWDIQSGKTSYKKINPNLGDLITGLLKFNSNQRYSIDKVLSHEWLIID